MKIKQLATVAALSIMTFFGAASVAHADTIYTVKSGDTLSEILTATGKGLGSMDQVAADNNIADDYQGDDAAAREWIAARESGGSYTANNGAYIGKYQMSAAYLNGDYSPANQDRVANNYVSSRYGSWTAAKQFWQANGWY